MTGLSDYAENYVLDLLLATAYLSLHTADPTDDASPTNELPVANGYARNLCAFDAAAGGQAANSANEDFTALGGDWGTVTHWAVWDAPAGGNMIFSGQLSASQAIADGDTYRIASGALIITGD